MITIEDKTYESLEVYIAKLEAFAKTLSESLVESTAKIQELSSSKLCGNCIHICKQGEDYYICDNTEFQTCTTPNTECFIGYKPRDSK